jgi:hypothetical protein
MADLAPAKVFRVAPNPVGMTWQEWADTVVGYNNVLRNQISSYLGWEEFADVLARIEARTPDPAGFTEWQEWALALRRALSF